MITFKSKIDILNLTSCELVVKGYTGNVTNITFDSRKVPLNSIFFALKGEKTDGHNFVVDALHKGASVAIVDKVLPEYKNVTGKTIIKVDSSIKFMANLAKEYRKMINADVIGITGTIGKTTTKYLVGSILSKRFNTLVSQESYNNLLGVSYTLLNYENEEKVVLELGINRLHEIEELVEIAKPDFAIITYITPVHLEGMHSIFEIFTQKRKIVKYARKIFINADSFLLNSLAHPHIVKVGTAEDLDYRGFIVRNELNITHFTINNEFFHIPSYTKSILYPALFAYAIGKEYGLSYSEIFDTFKNFSPPKMRFQILEKNNRIFVLDCYNANPFSTEKAIEEFSELTPRERVFILGDMLELGEKSAFYHRKIASILKKVDGLKILVGSYFQQGSDFLNKYQVKHYYFKEKEELAKALPQIIRPQYKFFLLKASRKLQLEDIVEYL